jgi:hypothetical protein
MTPEEREVLDVLHAIAKALESVSRHLYKLNELLRAVDVPPADSQQR